MADRDDSRKHWREAIGVVRPNRPARPSRPAGPRAPAPGSSGGAGATTDVRDRDADASTGPVTAPEPPPASAGAGASRTREAVGVSSTGLGAQAGTGGSGDPVARLLGELPVGSVSFAEAVSRTLWKNPSASDLKALAAIAGERHLIRDEALRSAVVDAVGARYRIERLSVGLARPILDPTVVQARAIEWGRMARRVESLVPQLRCDPREPGASIVEAAQSLLPEARELEAESRLASELAVVVEAAGDGETDEIEMVAIGVSDLPHLLAAVRRRSMRPWDGLALEALAAGLAVEKAIASGEVDELRLCRVLVRRLLVRFDNAVYELTHSRDKDLERKGRVALWLRYVRTLRSQIDEALTRPARRSELDTGPTGHAGTEAADARAIAGLRAAREAARERTGPRTTGPTAEDDPSTPLADDDTGSAPVDPEEAEDVARQLERELERMPLPGQARRSRTGADRLSMIAAAAVVVAFGLQAFRLLALPAPPPAPPAVAAQDFASALALLSAEPVGRLLVATVDPSWDRMATDERELALTRLMTVAEARGLQAGLLVAADGTPVARWAPGGPVELLRPPPAP
ncbi:MAG: hypothetical protein Kow0062_11820 [Acidobacteriota bacterium]